MNKLKERINVQYIGTLVASILIALLIGGLLMTVTGFNPFEAYGAMIEGSLGSPRFIGNTLERAMLLCLLGLATAIGAKGGGRNFAQNVEAIYWSSRKITAVNIMFMRRKRRKGV